jgi:hypothetical protein
MEQLKTLDENKSMWAEYDDPMIVKYAMKEVQLTDISMARYKI